MPLLAEVPPTPTPNNEGRVNSKFKLSPGPWPDQRNLRSISLFRVVLLQHVAPGRPDGGLGGL